MKEQTLKNEYIFRGSCKIYIYTCSTVQSKNVDCRNVQQYHGWCYIIIIAAYAHLLHTVIIDGTILCYYHYDSCGFSPQLFFYQLFSSRPSSSFSVYIINFLYFCVSHTNNVGNQSKKITGNACSGTTDSKICERSKIQVWTERYIYICLM